MLNQQTLNLQGSKTFCFIDQCFYRPDAKVTKTEENKTDPRNHYLKEDVNTYSIHDWRDPDWSHPTTIPIACKNLGYHKEKAAHVM